MLLLMLLVMTSCFLHFSSSSTSAQTGCRFFLFALLNRGRFLIVTRWNDGLMRMLVMLRCAGIRRVMVFSFAWHCGWMVMLIVWLLFVVVCWKRCLVLCHYERVSIAAGSARSCRFGLLLLMMLSSLLCLLVEHERAILWLLASVGALRLLCYRGLPMLVIAGRLRR